MLFVICDYCTITQTRILRENMTAPQVSDIDEKNRQKTENNLTKEFVSFTFSTLQKTLKNKNYQDNMKDISYKAPLRG